MDIRKFFGVVPSGKKLVNETVKKNENTKIVEGTSKSKKGTKEIKVKTSSKEDDVKGKRSNKKKRIIYDSGNVSEERALKVICILFEHIFDTKKLYLSNLNFVDICSISIPFWGGITHPCQSTASCVLSTGGVCPTCCGPSCRSLGIEWRVVLAIGLFLTAATGLTQRKLDFGNDEEDEFIYKKTSLKPKENGISSSSHIGTSNGKKAIGKKTQIKNKPLSPIKLTPTSVLDYFGTGSVQRSEKKLVASKRREPSQNTDDSRLNDEAIAEQLQIEENLELERQLHEDEEFARTLAMLDEEPKHKKARRNSEERETFSSDRINSSESEKHKVKPSNFSHEKNLNKQSKSEDSQPPSKSSPHKVPDKTEEKSSALKVSSKLALLKKKDESTYQKRESTESGKKNHEVVVKEERQSPKKNKISPSKTESVSPEDTEKKRTNYQAYRSYLNREGPKALGSKEIPKGAENCLEGLTFVITGVLESIERDDAKSLIERYGGKVTGNVSKKTSYLVMGRDSGQSKSDKALALGTKIIDEDGLLDLIRTLPGKKSKYEIAFEAEVKKEKSKLEKTPQKADQGKRKTSPNKKDSESKKNKLSPKKDISMKSETSEFRKGLNFNQVVGKKKAESPEKSVADQGKDKAEGLLWVDKYKPTSIKTIIGQQGEQSCANKLLRWLRNWHKNMSEDKKHVKAGKFGGKDDGSSFKAALLSGPPGIGKTTTASLVCGELGYSYVELNASDTRNKSSLKEIVAESLNNTSIKEFCSGSGTAHSGGTKHALIMDEVDGMAGSEDRGGIQELIGLIKHTKIPIICMCNDRNHPKIRSLVHYCFDLRFQRPRIEQIKGAMMSVAFKEGLKIPPPAMNEIILGANHDIRQVLHNLSMWCAESKALTYDQAKADSSRAKKDIKLGPFDVARKVFAAGEETAHMTLMDKSDLFFHDYSIAPLFVQENYLHVKPAAAGGDVKKHLMLLSRAADSICDGDLVDRQIRNKQNWSLLPTQAIYSSVLPGELMRGYMTQFPSFPSWLGKFSSTGKHDRIVQELALHMSLETHSSKRTVNLDYLSHMRDALVLPLTLHGTEGVQNVVELMDAYHLMREDFENIMEISSWGGKPSSFSKLDSKVKAAFTRSYNKEVHLTPYALQGPKAPRQSTGPSLGPDYGDDLNEDESLLEEKDPDNIETDAMIKKRTKSSKLSKPEKETQNKKAKGKSSKKS
ncbi:replication factor C subunit 1 [Sminthopsis crassicaudata]|uniref:replication factor C subunit 1 n=1 Tax=Sminthopsis crassicaudata TaxID=9301 RepID=UPI003D682E4B